MKPNEECLSEPDDDYVESEPSCGMVEIMIMDTFENINWIHVTVHEVQIGEGCRCDDDKHVKD